MRYLISCGALLSLVAGAQQVEKPLADKHWKQTCEAVTAQPLTALHPRDSLHGEALEKCDEQTLYHGLGRAPNYPAALQCGWYERDNPQNSGPNMFEGPGVLTMLYANGKGIPRNYNLAIRFACEIEGASDAEMEFRLGHLEHLRATHAETSTFDLCEDGTSSDTENECTEIATSTADTLRSRKTAALETGLAPVAREQYSVLKSTEHAFEEARSDHEINHQVSTDIARTLEEEKVLKDQFLINLQRFGNGDVPATTAQEAAELDGQLNRVYLQIQHAPTSKWDEAGTIEPEGIRTTERSWLTLVEAWVRFARVAYPNLSESSLRAQLIRLRLHQLMSLFHVS